MSPVDSGRAEHIARVVGGWSESLINLTGRNRLLNFTPKKTSAVPVTVSSQSEVLLGLKSGHRLAFQPLRPPTGESGPAEGRVSLPPVEEVE